MKRRHGVSALALMLAAWGCASERITIDKPRAWTPGEPAGEAYARNYPLGHGVGEGAGGPPAPRVGGGKSGEQSGDVPDLHGRDARATQTEEGASEQGYLLLGARQSVRLKGAYERWRAAVARVTIEGSLMDPMLSYGRFLNEFSSRQAMGQHEFELMQTFPWFGVLALREDAAAREAAMAAREYEGVRLALFRDIRVALYDLYLLGREIDLTRENLALVSQFEAIARTRFKVATGTHADVVRAQVEIGRLEDRVRELERMRTPALARLNAALSRPAGTAMAGVVEPEPERLNADAAQVLALLRAHSPRLAAMAEDVERRRAMTDLARKAYWPDVSVGAMYMVDGDDPAQVRVSVNVPLWRARLDAGVREANSLRLAAAYAKADEENMLEFELHEALFAHDDAQRRLELYARTLLPKAHESVRASLGAFQVGTGSFLELIDAQRTLLEFQLAHVRAAVERAVALARLDALVGTSVTRVRDEVSQGMAPGPGGEQ